MGVECPEMPFELVDITQDPGRKADTPLQGQPEDRQALMVSHNAPGVFGDLIWTPGHTASLVS